MSSKQKVELLNHNGVSVRPAVFLEQPSLSKTSQCHDGSIVEYIASFNNDSDETRQLFPYGLGELDIEFDNPDEVVPRFIHALNARSTEDGPIALPLVANEPVELAGRCPGIPHLEVTIVLLGKDQPVIVFGPTTQNVAHAFYRIEWDGGRGIRVRGRHKFNGIDARPLKPRETLPPEKWFVQVCESWNINTALKDYLLFLTAEVPDNGRTNPLVNETFLATWNNHAYWLINEDTIKNTAETLRQRMPDSRWIVIDDGYQKTPTQPPLPQAPGGEYIHDFEIEKGWFKQAPGVTFGFSTGDGVNLGSFPRGLRGAVDIIRDNGMRPGIWVGMEAAWSSPTVEKQPEWFLKSNFHDDEDPTLNRAIPDLSIQAVRDEIKEVFRYLFEDCGFESLKIDFVTLLTDDPRIKYSNSEKSGAEWRNWLFDMIRNYVPVDGFVSMACYMPMGAPFFRPWLDSVRHSFDQRDGEWSNVLRNIRWSVVPQLALGHNLPILDADSLSIFPQMDRTALTLWADYALVTGTLHEFSGSLEKASAEEIHFLEFYLNNKDNGAQVFYGESSFLEIDGLPRVVYRACPTSMVPDRLAASQCLIMCLCNWSNEATSIELDSWNSELREYSRFYDLRSGEVYTSKSLGGLELPPRSSLLICASLVSDAQSDRSVLLP